MKELKCNKEEAEAVFKTLTRDYRLIAPVEQHGRGTFSDTNLITYNEVHNLEEIEFFKKTMHSAKEVLFPIRQTLFTFQQNKMQQSKEDFLPTIIFLRACDLHAIAVMDAHFLGGKYEDPYYKQRRDVLKCCLMECGESFENCFCVSMGANHVEDYDLFVRKMPNGYEVRVKDPMLEPYFFSSRISEVKPIFVEEDQQPLKLPKEIHNSVFTHPIWTEYSQRCIACGRCNTSCPTCSCFTIQDVSSEDKSERGERRRIWSSCQVKNFALLAGNHDFRIPKGDQMRYKVLHKIQDFKKRNGIQMCVGCGRCDDVCPEYISMSKCIQKINTICEAEGS